MSCKTALKLSNPDSCPFPAVRTILRKDLAVYNTSLSGRRVGYPEPGSVFLIRAYPNNPLYPQGKPDACVVGQKCSRRGENHFWRAFLACRLGLELFARPHNDPVIRISSKCGHPLFFSPGFLGNGKHGYAKLGDSVGDQFNRLLCSIPYGHRG